jgi:hypothetical protein
MIVSGVKQPSSAAPRLRGSVRLAVLCALAGAAGVLVWSTLQPRDPRTAMPLLSPAPVAAPDAPLPPATSTTLPDSPLQRSPVDPARGIASQDDLVAPATPTPDADGFSPDYGALVDEFQQQRALDPLVDD